MLGGKSHAIPASEDIKIVVKELQKQERIMAYPMFKAIEFTKQLVNGLLYNVKVQINEEGECVFIRFIQKPGQESMEMLGFETGFNLDSQLK